MFELMDTYGQQAVIKVVGVGGGGGNAVNHMVGANIDGVEFISANTDAQALKDSKARTILQLGVNLTKGLGCGADPSRGRQHNPLPSGLGRLRCANAPFKPNPGRVPRETRPSAACFDLHTEGV